jgi:hypothetical protein
MKQVFEFDAREIARTIAQHTFIKENVKGAKSWTFTFTTVRNKETGEITVSGAKLTFSDNDEPLHTPGGWKTE